MSLTIGSGSVGKLLSSKTTKGYRELVQDFVSTTPKNWNSFASPIDALRTGAILELQFLKHLDDSHYFQYKVEHPDLDCLVSTLDFALLDKGRVISFKEFKTIFFNDFLEFIVPLKNLKQEDQVDFIKKKFKNNYLQVQFQMLCCGINEADLIFLYVDTYEDDSNYKREINDKDYISFTIPKDEEVCNNILERAQIFQQLKNELS